MKHFSRALQTVIVLTLIALGVYASTHDATILLSSPFPQSTADSGVPTTFIVLYVLVLIYIVSAFRLSSYWQRLYRVLLSIGVLLGVHYLHQLVTPAADMWWTYAVAAAILGAHFSTAKTFVHTTAQVLLTFGVTVWVASHVSVLQAWMLLMGFSIYDLIAGFFPRQMFDAVAKFFQVDHLVSIVIPDRLRGWWDSHHEQQTAIRSLDVMIPLIFTTLVTYELEHAAFWISVAAWLIGVLIRFTLPLRLQHQMIIPALCLLVGYALALL